MEMKLDVARLPAELSKMPSVSVQLKMDEYSTISKLAKVNSQQPISQSVITQAPAAATAQAGTAVITDINRSKSPVVRKDAAEKKSSHVSAVPAQKTATTKYQVAYTTGTGASGGTQVQLAPGSGLAVQTAQGNIVVYSVASSVNTTQTVSIVQGGSVVGGGASTVSTNSRGGQAYTIGVPAYIDGSNLYQTVHLVPAASAGASTIVSGSQQVVYWPPQSTATVGTSQIAVVPQGQVLQPVQIGVDKSSTKESTVTAEKKNTAQPSVITID